MCGDGRGRGRTGAGDIASLPDPSSKISPWPLLSAAFHLLSSPRALRDGRRQGGGGRLQRQRDLDRGSEEEGSLLVSSFIKAEKMFTH